jgi:hypothetical protein
MSLVKIQGNASGTGEFTIAAPNSNTNYTLTLPAATGTLNTSGAVNEVPAGSASAPSIYPTGDTNTGIFFPAADTIGFAEGGAEVARFDSSGNLGLSVTPSAWSIGTALQVKRASFYTYNNDSVEIVQNGAVISGAWQRIGADFATKYGQETGTHIWSTAANSTAGSAITWNERARITSGGALLVGATALPTTSNALTGTAIYGAVANGQIESATSGEVVFVANRKTSDGTLVLFRQDGTDEGDISVSGSTVSYNGGHLSRWAQMLTKPDLLKGTVMSNLDEMNVYIASTTYWTEEDELPEGVSVGDVKVETHEVENEQLNKVKVSDVEGDVNVAGVFVNWTYDEQHQVDEINMAMTGDMIIRIAQGVVVQKGDLLMSAGDGTAKPQDDDIVRSKTVAKVTSNHVTCTYEDGSYCVPCVLMAC